MANIPAGVVTIKPSSTQPDRIAMVAAIFTPASSAFVWSGSGGSAGNGTWNLTSTNNWNFGSLSAAYSNGYAVTFSDGARIPTSPSPAAELHRPASYSPRTRLPTPFPAVRSRARPR